jgi:hypothetical protein
MTWRRAWRPDPDQEAMLDIALGPDREARAAWERWRAHADLDALDPGSYRLLPLLWRRLFELGHADLDGRLKGVYRRTWYRNQLQLSGAARLIEGLVDRGIDTALLKGAALALFHYRDVGVRPMDDVDLLVPAERAAEAVSTLLDAGWRPEPTPLKGTGPRHAAARLPWLAWAHRGRSPERFTPTYFAVRHAHGFRGPNGLNVDLHWHVLQEVCDPDADRAFWDDAAGTELHGAGTRALRPADQLLHVLAHAGRWNPVPPVRWVADADAVLRSSGDELDWDRLLAQARRHRLTLPLSEMLDYLSDRFGLPVPESARSALRGETVTPAERQAYRVRATSPGLRAARDEYRYLRGRYRTLRAERGAVGEMKSFRRFVAWILGARRPADVALYGAYEAARRILT